jgi:hypothetical protein
MIRIDKQLTFAEVPDVTVWQDDTSYNTFYALPQSPRFRLQNGVPVVKEIIYRLPVPRADGKEAGGYVMFDTELAISDEQLAKLKQILDARVTEEHQRRRLPGTPPPAQFGSMTFTKGTVKLLLEKDGVLIEKVTSAGKPSLYGNNVATFAIELTAAGAAVFDAAMKKQGASMVSVVYDLNFWVKLPPLTATVWFNASQFYSFYQTIDTDWSLWGEDSYRETIREKFLESRSGGTEINFDFTLPDAEQDKKLKDKIRDWAQRTLEDMVEKSMIESIAPVPEDKRKAPDGIEDVTRDIQVTKAKSFRQTYRENGAADWNLVPQGNLGAVAAMKDSQGHQLKWEDFSMLVDADHPFFRKLNVTIQTNADFQRLNLFSIEVKVSYKVGSINQVKEFKFTKPDDVGKFETFIENDVRQYTYSYQVNYKGSAQAYQSPDIKTDETQLTINVDDLGCLIVDIKPGDINFEQVAQALLTMQYEDTNVPRFEQQFVITKEHAEHQLRRVIMQPWRKPYTYQLKYFMKDGLEYTLKPATGLTPDLFIGDPFSGTKTIAIRAMGNLDTDIDTIFADFKYIDEANNYTQTKSIALTKAHPFEDWSFPAIDPAGGKAVYSGSIKFKNGQFEPIPETTTTQNTVLIGKLIQETLKVEVMPDFLNFDVVTLVKVSLKYDDAANGIHVQKDFVFKKSAATTQTWSVELRDKNQREYQWRAEYFLPAGGPPKTRDWAKSTEPTLLVPMVDLAHV